MIQTKDVRIGNWVTVKGYYGYVTGIDLSRCYIEYADGRMEYFSLDMITPIPLTPEILEKAGFEKGKVSRQVFYELIFDNVKFLYIDGEGLRVGVQGVAQYEWLPHSISMVHRLQNIFYYTTNTELNISL